MSGLPWYKRYGADFVFGTMGLTLEERGAYSIIIDLIHDRGKPIPDDARFMAGILGVSTRKWRSLRNALIEAGKIYEEDGFLSNERCDADLAESEERARKQAESGAKGGRKRAENALNSERNERETQKKSNEIKETGQGTLKPTRSQKLDKKRNPPTPLEGEVQSAFDSYNDVAEELGLPVAHKLTPDRRRKIAARLRDHGIDDWRSAVAALRDSDHCQGKNDRGWKADLDFVCQPKSFNRLIEGGYASARASPKWKEAV